MKKYYRICEKLICIEASSFPGDNPQWTQFETEGNDADINITCKISEPFPETNGGVRSGEFVVSVNGDKVYREFPMGKIPGAFTVYNPDDTSHSETLFTQRSFPIMMDNRYMWSSISLAQLMLGQNLLGALGLFKKFRDQIGDVLGGNIEVLGHFADAIFDKTTQYSHLHVVYSPL